MRMFRRDFRSWQLLGIMLAMVCGVGVIPGTVSAANWLTEDVSKGLFSVGGRAMYFNPIDGSASWYGGGQVRLHLGEVFAIEGSADYRKNDFGNDTTVHTFPVQASGLLYLLPGKRVSPFLLGGAGWYFTNVNGPDGYDKTQNRFGLHAGGGLQVMLSRNWSVDGSYRFVWLERVQSKDENLQNKKFQDEGHMVTIGLNYHF